MVVEVLVVVVSGLLTSTETEGSFGGGFWDGFGSGGGFSGLFRGFRRCRRLGRGFRFRDYLSPELPLFLCWLIRACFRGLRNSPLLLLLLHRCHGLL